MPHARIQLQAFLQQGDNNILGRKSLGNYLTIASFRQDNRRLAEDIGERAAYAEDENELMMKLDDTVGSIIIMGAGELDSVKDRILRSE